MLRFLVTCSICIAQRFSRIPSTRPDPERLRFAPSTQICPKIVASCLSIDHAGSQSQHASRHLWSLYFAASLLFYFCWLRRFAYGFLGLSTPGKVLPIAGDEEISSVLAVDNFREDEYLVLLTQVKGDFVTKIQQLSAPPRLPTESSVC